ncbi:MAG: hypothetical protein LBH18_02310 [Spirochaetaceae bacterium]|jgi:hypothetical protein|nr:hypothetical protein [Spirochaetaceae bacterium]
MKNGRKNWYIVDGWIPAKNAVANSGYEGHEALIILNCNDKPTECFLDFYFEDREPVENISVTIPAKRVKCFRLDKKEEIGGVELGRLCQYSLRVRSAAAVVVQFGRMDVTQENCAYIGLMGYGE